MAHFVREGNSVKVFGAKALSVSDKLEPFTYLVKTDMQGLLYLEQVDSFTLPKKLYGNALRNRDRIWNTFDSRKGPTGVLLSGEKGNGKTLLAKSLSIHGMAQKVPTILVTRQFPDCKIGEFLQSIEQPCVVVLDEFEKTFEKEDQEELLTVLDGTLSSKMLFIITCNDVWKVDEHMLNRPGRIFYALSFDDIESTIIDEYCKDHLKNGKSLKEEIDKIHKIVQVVGKFNFDQLQSLVEEMNRYGEDAFTAMELLNIKPTNGKYDEYSIALTHPTKEVKICYNNTITGNPFGHKQINIEYEYKNGKTDCLYLSPKNIVDSKSSNEVIVMEQKGFTVTFTKEKAKEWNYKDALHAM